MIEKKGTPTGLAPSADSEADKRRGLRLGKGTLMVIAGIAVCAFALYTFIALYGIFTAR
jgi:hypothetical protein